MVAVLELLGMVPASYQAVPARLEMAAFTMIWYLAVPSDGAPNSSSPTSREPPDDMVTLLLRE